MADTKQTNGNGNQSGVIQQITPHSEHVNPGDALRGLWASIAEHFWGGDKTNVIDVNAEQVIDIIDPIKIELPYESPTGARLKFSFSANNTVNKKATATLKASSVPQKKKEEEEEEE